MWLIGMTAACHLTGLPFGGWGSNPDASDKYDDRKLLALPLSSFQRSCSYVLAHGIDAVDANMQSLAHLEENVITATTSPEDFAR